ncbi:MAG: hypothetical protein KF780_13720 [Sphingomonas sp.]|nr:hypothetical protein [Sphingomonas sp.]
MRDELDARMWNDNHQQFSVAMDGAIGAIGGALRFGASRAASLPGQIISLIAAFGITALSLGGTIA